MASFRVHEDQENGLIENRLKMAGNGNGQQKRAVLGAIDNRLDLFVKQKQVRVVLGSILSGHYTCFGFQILDAGNSKVLEENVNNKENAKNKQALKENDKKLVVPVAQFKAFKVYEDEEKQQQLQQPSVHQPPKLPKNVENDPYSIYKDQIGNRFITKTELAEIEGKPKPKEPSPMSIEKCENVEPKLQTEIITAGRSSRDIFFEMEEYRASIYQYLREHEVSFQGCVSTFCLKDIDCCFLVGSFFFFLF